MKRNTLYNLLTASAALMLVSCSGDDGTVSISGTVNDGQGEKIALMHLSGSNPVLVDTLTLGSNGSFSFKAKVEKGGPDFFCLVMNGQTIPVISDTLQTPIVITTEKEKFSTVYQANDDLNNELHNAVSVGGDMRRSVVNLISGVRDGSIPQQEFAAKLDNVISEYKSNVLTNYIYQDPASPISYYLLFETVSGLQIFNPLDATDNRAYGAVANLWLATYPNSPRTAYLEQSAREGIAMRVHNRRESQRADSLVQNAMAQSTSYLDLNLLGRNDEQVALSSLAGNGKVTLLDFTAFYVSEASVPHNETLNTLYRKYRDQGLQIYQVCMDPDINFWKVSAANLPWTVVRDPELLFDEDGSLVYSAAARVYNVSVIPTTFVMARDGSVVSRIEDDDKLDAAVSKAL